MRGLGYGPSRWLWQTVAVGLVGSLCLLPTGVHSDAAAGSEPHASHGQVDKPPGGAQRHSLRTPLNTEAGAVGAQEQENMILIPGGEFTMGDSLGEGTASELPVHTVKVSTFFIDRTEVAKGLWDSVYRWAVSQGYAFDNRGDGKAADHPVHSVTWYDAVKWCNARSEKEGLTPVYRIDAAKKTIYRTGQVDLLNDWVMWDADGYRLPTDAEWEKAARGGVAGRRFPWHDADTVTHDRANYHSRWEQGRPYYSYDTNPTPGFHAKHHVGSYHFTSPVGSFSSTGHGKGLFDMAGNVWEWCWDWWAEDWYRTDEAGQPDPAGPASGTERVLRGGSWYDSPFLTRCSAKAFGVPSYVVRDYGFRCVRGASSSDAQQGP
jgi:formylglycine-generating enzyme required for sulfatase activity